MGVEIAKAALAAGHNVVATGRNPDTVANAVGDADRLLAAKLDVTSTHDAESAIVGSHAARSPDDSHSSHAEA